MTKTTSQIDDVLDLAHTIAEYTICGEGNVSVRLDEKYVSKFVDKEGYFPKLILLQNHGIISASASKKDCAASTLMCEKSADIFIGARLLGGVKFLTEQEVADVDLCPNENYRRNMYR